MNKIEHSAIVEYSAEQMYQLVNDVAAYPEFLPWCAATEILDSSETQMTASMSVKKGPITQAFTTKNDLVVNKSITMNLLNGPFEYMQGIWQFKVLEAQACKITFSLDFKFNNKLLAMTLSPVFKMIADTMIDAFMKRAEVVYG